MPTQACPACSALNDVSIFVSGQLVRCAACNLPFRVRRSDQAVVPAGATAGAAAQPVVAPQRRPVVVAEAPRPAAEPQPERPAAHTDPAGPGLEIPGFELHEVIGKGGMGKVFRAVQRSLQREVAIKVLNEDLARHQSFIRRFEKEAHSLAALQHPNIATIHDTSHVGPHYYLVMEYIGGQSLRHMLNLGRLSLDRVGGLFSTLCSAVEHAHKNRVIHRDLKPENVLFTREGVLKVVDFGLANILDEQGRWELTRTRVSMGTVNYMAPEQRKDAKHVDHRADIYSLGVMLYEMLTGELPLGRFEDPSRRRADVPAELDRLVARMLDFEPDRRPQGAGLVAHTLARLLGTQPSAGAVAAGPALPAPAPAAPQEPAPAEEPSTPPAGPRLPPAAPGRGRRFTRALWMLAAGATLLVGAAVLAFVVFLRHELNEAPGDMLVRLDGGAVSLSLVHPHEVRQVKPREDGLRAGARWTRFDFQPGSLPALPVRFLGGDWSLERSGLVQDTSRKALTVNQRPARAVLGREAVPGEGLVLRARLSLEESTWSEEGREPRSMQQILAERLPGAQAWLPTDMAPSAGLAVLDEQGERGLLVKLPRPPARQGGLSRLGPDMEGGDETFELPAGRSAGEPLAVDLRIKDGRLKLSVGSQPVLDRLAGFPVAFRGLPAVICQNARCTFMEVEYSSPAGVR